MGIIILSVIIGLVVLGIIGFAFWFSDRTPDNLSGYYDTPVITIVSIVSIVLIAVIVSLFFIF